MHYQLNSQEKKELQKIKKAYYIQPTLSRINQFIQSNQEQKEAYKLVLNELNQIITEAHAEVDKILDKRVQQGDIRNKEQAKKVVVGNTFPFAVIYIFMQNKICLECQ